MSGVTVQEQPRRGRVWPWLLAVGLLVVVLVAFMAWQAWSAYRHLDRAEALLPDARSVTVKGDVRGGERALDRLLVESGAAHDALDGPHWALAARLPFVGDDVEAVRTVTRGFDQLARRALPQLLKGADAAHPRAGSLKGGRIDLDRVESAQAPLQRALITFEAVDRRNGAIDQSGLTSRVRRPVERFVDTVAQARRNTDAASAAVELMPDMLGGDGPRTYLVVNQNTAEQRVLGGIAGSVLLVRADEGKVRLMDTFTAGDVEAFDEPVLPLTRAEETLHGTGVGRFLQNVTDVPDFSRSARLTQAMWQQRKGTRVDGVLATDPYALQLMLRALGPVKVPGGRTLTGENAAEVLLNRTYAEVQDPLDQDAFFADAAKAVFAKLTSGEANPNELINALSQATAQHRMLVWSQDKKEESRLRDFRLAGEWAAPGESPRLGVFLHDSTGSKMSWYQQVDVDVTIPCSTEESRIVRARVTVRSTAPRNAAQLPQSITGDGSQIRRGHMLTQVVVYAPPGWTFADWRFDDGNQGMTMVQSGPSWAGARTLRLPPGASRTLEFDLRAPGSVEDFAVRTTPGVTPRNVKIAIRGCGV